jgi:hypothetical protein
MTVYVLVLNRWDPCWTLKAAAVLGVFSTREAAERTRGGDPDAKVTEHVLDQVGEVEFGPVWSVYHDESNPSQPRGSKVGQSLRRRDGWECTTRCVTPPRRGYREDGSAGFLESPDDEKVLITVHSAVSREQAEEVLNAALRLLWARRALHVATRRGVSAEEVRMLGREIEEAKGGFERLRTPTR